MLEIDGVTRVTHAGFSRAGWVGETESLAAPGAFAGTAAVRCNVAAPAIPGAKLLRNGLAFTGQQLETVS